MNYKNAWERLVAENGLDRAKEIMKERRAQNVDNKGGSFRDKEFAKLMSQKAIEAKRKKKSEND